MPLTPQTKTKLVVAGLVASLSFAAYKAQWEGEVLEPYYDSGKVATIGIGTTQYPPWYLNGKKVSINDPRITPTQSREFAAWHSKKDAEYLRNSLPGVHLTQEEFDIYLDFMYQFGRGAWQGSTMRQHLLASANQTQWLDRHTSYLNACNALLNWRKVRIKGKLVDCKARNSGCYGVWKRQVWRAEVCKNANLN